MSEHEDLEVERTMQALRRDGNLILNLPDRVDPEAPGQGAEREVPPEPHSLSQLLRRRGFAVFGMGVALVLGVAFWRACSREQPSQAPPPPPAATVPITVVAPAVVPAAPAPAVPGPVSGAAQQAQPTAAERVVEAINPFKVTEWHQLMVWYDTRRTVAHVRGTNIPLDPRAPGMLQIGQASRVLSRLASQVQELGGAAGSREWSLLQKKQTIFSLLQSPVVFTAEANLAPLQEFQQHWRELTDRAGWPLSGPDQKELQEFLDSVAGDFATGRREPSALVEELETATAFVKRVQTMVQERDAILTRTLKLARTLARNGERRDVLQELNDPQLDPAQVLLNRRREEERRAQEDSDKPPPLPPALQRLFNGLRQDQEGREEWQRSSDAYRAEQGLGPVQEPGEAATKREGSGSKPGRGNR